MTCPGCGKVARSVKTVFNMGKSGKTVKVEGCSDCMPRDNEVMLFNYVIGPQGNRDKGGPGARQVARRGVSAAHVRDLRRRRGHIDFSDPNNPKSWTDNHAGRVIVDMKG